MKFCLITCAVLLAACSASRRPAVKTPLTGTFTDERDGQVYKWVKIGHQVWMAQNLNYKTPDGSFAYDDREENRAKYGLYYLFPSLIDACPKGWHVATDADWQELEKNIGVTDAGGDGYRGDVAAALLPDGNTGFNLLYAGWYKQGRYDALGQTAYFWTATQSGAPVYARMFKRGYNAIYRGRWGIAYAMSVRCVKNTESGK